MSYRNPTIVNDQSGAVLGQAIAQGAQNIAKGIIGMEAQNRAAKERAAKQAEIDEKKAIAEANAQVAVIEKNAKNAQAQYARVQENMKNVGDNFGISMKSAVDRLGQYNMDFINDKSPEKIKQIKEANEEIAALNEIITDWGAYLPEASNYSQLASSDIMNNVSYTSIGGDDGSKAKATVAPALTHPAARSRPTPTQYPFQGARIKHDLHPFVCCCVFRRGIFGDR